MTTMASMMADSVMHHRVIGVMVFAMGVAECYGLRPLIAPLVLLALGLYGWTFQFNGPEDVTHRLFSSLAVAGGLFETWRRLVRPQGWTLVSQALLLLAAVFLLGHRHNHHQTLFVTLHHMLFGVLLITLAWLYTRERPRGMTVMTAGVILMVYFID
jgi:hypothetical protein